MKYEYKRKVNYYETDRMQIVHHSNYIRYFEEARIEMMEVMGLPYDAMEKEKIWIPVLGVECNYKVPATFGDTIIVETEIEEYNAVRMTMKYTIKKENGDICVTGKSKHCFTTDELRPISLKKVNPAMNEIFEKALEN